MLENQNYYLKKVLQNSTLCLRVYNIYYKLIDDGKKKIEYRDFNVKWCLRLISNLNIENTGNKLDSISIPEQILIHHIKYVQFSNANNIYSPIIKFEIEKIDIGDGYPVLGAKIDEVYFRIHLGKRLY